MTSSARECFHKFLQEYALVKSGKLNEFSSGLLINSDLYNEIKRHIELPSNLVDSKSLIEILFDLFRSQSLKFRNFASQFIPVYLLSYLQSFYDKTNKVSWSNISLLEGFLLGMYNVLISDCEKQYENLPSLSKGSIYNYGFTHPDLNDKNVDAVVFETVEIVQAYVSATNRWHILTCLLRHYVSNIHEWPSVSKHSFIALCTRSASLSVLPRMQCSSSFLLEIIYGTYCLMFHEHFPNAWEAHKTAYERATYEMMVLPTMIANAASNFLLMSPPISEDSKFTRMQNPRPSIGGNAITNATFKPEKLPEDIPVMPKDNDTVDASLVTIEMKHDKPKLIKASTLPVLTINGIPSKDQHSNKPTIPVLHFKRFDKPNSQGDNLKSIAENGSNLANNGSVSDDSDCD